MKAFANHRLNEKLGLALCAALLLMQVAAILHARLTPTRLFCWAPYDTQDRYRIEVAVGQHVLTPEETTERYRFSSDGWQQHSIHNLLEAIAQYETSYGKRDEARVKAVFSLNGDPDQIWTFP